MGLFKSYSEKEVKRIMPLVQKINNLEGEIQKLSDEQLKEKTTSDYYDFIIVDSDGTGSWKRNLLMYYAKKILVINDGSEISQIKLKRLLQETMIRDENEDKRILSKIQVIDNRCSENVHAADPEYQDLMYGRMKRLERTAASDIAKEIGQSPFFDRLM